MRKRRLIRKIFKWVGIIVATPIVLSLVLGVLVYIPPVQRFAVERTTRALSDDTGMDIHIGYVRLAFPFDLALGDMQAIMGGDTLLDARSLRLGVRLWPLVYGRAEMKVAYLTEARINTLDLIPDTHIRGYVGQLRTALPGGVNLKQELVLIDRILLKNTDLLVELGDTAREDTTPSAPSQWDIHLRRADILDTRVALRMPGDSMHIGAYIGRGTVRGGRFDTGRGYYGVRTLALDRSSATYDVPQAICLIRGLDPNHIAVDELDLRVDSVSYDSAGTLGLNLRRLAFVERSGFAVGSLTGSVRMDTASLSLPRLSLITPHSWLEASAAVDWAALEEGKGGFLAARLEADLGRADLLTLAGGMLSPDLHSLVPAGGISASVMAEGNMDYLALNRLDITAGRLAQLTATGHAERAMSDDRSGQAVWKLSTGDLSTLEALMPSAVTLPPRTNAEGEVEFRGDDYRIDLALGVPGGKLTATGGVNLTTEQYDIQLAAHSFPLAAFVPDMGLSDLTAALSASGRGFDPLAATAMLRAEAAVDTFRYDTYPLDNLSLNADLDGGKARLAFTADNLLVQGNGTVDAALTDTLVSVALAADIPLVNMQQISGGEDSTNIGVNIGIDLTAKPDFKAFDISGKLADIRFITSGQSVAMKDIAFAFGTAPDTTRVMVKSGDLDLWLLSGDGLESLGTQAGRFADTLFAQLEAKHLDQETLRGLLPPLSLYVNAGKENPAVKYLSMNGIGVDSIFVNLNADAVNGLNGHADAFTVRSGQLQLDDIKLVVSQDSTGVKLDASVINSAADNPNQFKAYANAFLKPRGAGVAFQFYDSEGVKGVDVGVEAILADSGIAVTLFPEKPVIAYRDFTINAGNYLYLSNKQAFHANVNLLADDGTALLISGQPKDSVNDVTLSIEHLNLGELSNVLPYMPRLGGKLNADIHVLQSPHDLTSMGAVEVDSMAYEDIALGDISLYASYMPEQNHHLFDATVQHNNRQVLECAGVYADTAGGFFAGRAALTNFPLRMANGFLAGTDVLLDGWCNGQLSLHGPVDGLLADGQVTFDSARVFSPAYGFDLRMDTIPIVISGNRLSLTDFSLHSTGENPLLLNGAVDFTDLSRVTMNLDVQAFNYELINTKRRRESLLFGKVYTNLRASMRGTMEHISVAGQLDILGNTDMTYVLKDSPLTVDDQLEGLVQFVDFSDTTTVDEQEQSVMGMDIAMAININEAAHFRCELSDDKSSYVDLEGGGSLTFRLDRQGDMRLTGRLTVNSGEMKYALPVIPLKTFQIVQGSYIEFLGDITNPTLNLAAKERVKASVTENDATRSVSFDVGIAVTQPLNQMGLEFTIEAPEDLSVQNQLAAMTAEQRGKTAVTMLATGMYINDEASGSGSGIKANDALNAFLQSEIQNIAGSALSTIDINFGVESGTSSSGTEQTDYSFQFAKRFWGNRISIIIGGKVSTGSDTENSAESFIDNVSVEYRLDKSSTRHVKAFYDRNTNDPLEGQLTKTGAGLVLRRKTNKLGELFIFRTPKPKKTEETPATTEK